jgi:galactokinase/mevalonate kinase-like predicted kinase
MKKQLKFPFECIIVTSPDEASARSAEGPLKEILQRDLCRLYPDQSIQIISTCDPLGARCGSGGGTLAALEECKDYEKKTILMLHAGGDSSRCPTQMILGKAWTSLSCDYKNPTIWLIEQLHQLYLQANLPQGTLVVAATDCLAIFGGDLNGSRIPEIMNHDNHSTVLGVAVPAPVTTAKNHGVYVLPQQVAQNHSKMFIHDPLLVWQKPSVEQLVLTKVPAPSSFLVPGHADPHAWIDTGIVIFLPKAVQTLKELSQGILQKCTKQGLQRLHQESNSNETLEEFARRVAPKVDLYTDILHSLSWPSQERNGTKDPLRQILSRLPLQILVAPQGKFLHLGTTKELVDFAITGAYPTEATSNLVRHLDLVPQYHCLNGPNSDQNVLIYSTFCEKTHVGPKSLVEYCDVTACASVAIGENTLLSGWRAGVSTEPLNIPSNLAVQMLALNKEGDQERFLYMVLGMEDPIKTSRKQATLYGLAVENFLAATQLSLHDLGWSEGNDVKDKIWTAEIHPIVPPGTSFDSVFEWLHMLGKEEAVSSHPSLAKWKGLKRLSLKQLHDQADAGVEWQYRQDLEKEIDRHIRDHLFYPQLQASLRDRCHSTPCDMKWIIDIYQNDPELGKIEILRALTSMDEIAIEGLEKENYDICGRAFMVLSALLADLATLAGQEAESLDSDEKLLLEVQTACSPYIEKLRSSSIGRHNVSDRKHAFLMIAEQRHSLMESHLPRAFPVYSKIMERLAFCMTELGVWGGLEKWNEKLCSESSKEPPLRKKWAMSTAPARVDLAGAWSDTPPICYEFGGSVTGMAVTVDDHKPLSSRCRIVTGGRGMLLRTELRNSYSGDLSSHLQVEITEMHDMISYRDPFSDCALLKCALVTLGMVSLDDIQADTDLQAYINKFCGSEDEDVRLEIVSTSLLPQGSGMGTSSILGGCVLAAVAKCIGMGDLDTDYLNHAVLMLEQLLTTGGGYQDQVHGIVQGVKTVRSNSNTFPLVMSVEKISITPETQNMLEERLILAFTGVTRFANNILQNVLRRWARRTPEIVRTVVELVRYSEDARNALREGDLEFLGSTLNDCWKRKVVMAGHESGVEPVSIKFLISELQQRKAIVGGSLCGAGGGGFMVMLAAEGFNSSKVRAIVQEELVELSPDLALFTWHECRICNEGLSTSVLEETGIGVESFQLAWQSTLSS